MAFEYAGAGDVEFDVRCFGTAVQVLPRPLRIAETARGPDEMDVRRGEVAGEEGAVDGEGEGCADAAGDEEDPVGGGEGGEEGRGGAVGSFD